MLSAVVFLPLAGAAVIALFLKTAKLVRGFALAVAVADLALALIIFWVHSQDRSGLQLVERYDWIQPLNVHYFLGVDGLSAPLVLLAGLLGMCAVFASWNIQVRVKEYFIWLLVLQTSVMGVFVSLDFVLFFVFWELELLPMYMLISIWGSGRKEYSAMKFLTFNLFGSAFMLVGLLVLYFSTGTFDIVALPVESVTGLPLEIDKAIAAGRLLIPGAMLFFSLFLAFAIKLPVWPLHTWLPDAHTDAPTGVSVMLAGVLLKMGGYGLIRICVTMFPQVVRDYAWLLVTLAVISVVYGAIVTLRQTDLKRLVAFSSVSHMGFVLLGISSVGTVAENITPVGLNGAAMQMFTHGTITGLLFLLVGLVYDKTHTRHIPDLRGLASQMPFVATVFVVAGLAALGLPGLSGFVAEVLVFVGTYAVWNWPTAIAVTGVVLAAGYILWMIQRILFGPPLARYDQVGDASIMEAIPLVVLVVAIVVVGVYPAILTDAFNAGITPMLEARFG